MNIHRTILAGIAALTLYSTTHAQESSQEMIQKIENTYFPIKHRKAVANTQMSKDSIKPEKAYLFDQEASFLIQYVNEHLKMPKEISIIPINNTGSRMVVFYDQGANGTLDSCFLHTKNYNQPMTRQTIPVDNVMKDFFANTLEYIINSDFTPIHEEYDHYTNDYKIKQ